MRTLLVILLFTIPMAASAADQEIQLKKFRVFRNDRAFTVPFGKYRGKNFNFTINCTEGSAFRLVRKDRKYVLTSHLTGHSQDTPEVRIEGNENNYISKVVESIKSKYKNNCELEVYSADSVDNLMNVYLQRLEKGLATNYQNIIKEFAIREAIEQMAREAVEKERRRTEP